MKDKKDIVIIALLLIIALGSGYWLGQTRDSTPPTSTVNAPEELATTAASTTPEIKPKRDIRKEAILASGSILVSDVRIKIVKLNLYPDNPTKDNVPLIYDQHELANQEFPIYFTGKVLGFYDTEYKIKWRQEEIKNGMHHGKSIWWHKNGTKQFEAKYVRGVRRGIARMALWNTRGSGPMAS